MSDGRYLRADGVLGGRRHNFAPGVQQELGHCDLERLLHRRWQELLQGITMNGSLGICVENSKAKCWTPPLGRAAAPQAANSPAQPDHAVLQSLLVGQRLANPLKKL